MGNRRFSLLTVIFSLLGGVVSFLLGEVLLANLEGSLPAYVIMGIYFGLAALIIGSFILMAQYIMPNLVGQRWKQKYFKTSLAFLVPSTLLMVGLCSGILQGLYGFEMSKSTGVKDIIFAIDTSGSMNDTDPSGERFDAVNQMIDNLDNKMQIAMITFNDEPSLVFDFMPLGNNEQREKVKQAISNIPLEGQGTTEVRAATEYAYELLQDRSDTNRKASLIFVSDGNPTDNSGSNIPSLVENYVNSNISIYTVGMMYSAEESEAYLEEMASLTNGQHVSTSDTSMIKGAYDKIRCYQGDRNLLDVRYGESETKWTYAVGRVLMISVIGIVLAIGIGIIFDNRFLVKGMIVGAIIGSLIGGSLLELCIGAGIEPTWARLIYMLLFSICLPMFTFSVLFKESYHGTLQA